MKKIYLHIGFHKTGTSALQEYFNDNREHLISNNIFYPEVYQGKFPGNVDLSWAFNNNPPSWSTVNEKNKETILSFYKEQLDNTDCDNIIISSEDFSLLDVQPEAIKSIKDYFSNYEFKIIAYVRNPLDFILSLYSHAVRAGRCSASFKEYIVENFNFRSADYPLRLQPWRNIFGKENLIVKKYDPKNFKKNSLIVDFFDAVNLEVNISVTMKKSNVGVHPWLIKPYIEISTSELDEEVKHKKLAGLRHISEGLPKENAVEYLLDDQDIAMIESMYQVSKNRLRREYNLSLD